MSSTDPFGAGLGGKVDVRAIRTDDIDPTLDDCCRREEEAMRRQATLKVALDKFDVTKRRQRQLVQTMTFTGCRCCYHPEMDGGGDYRALEALRAEQGAEQVEVEVLREDSRTAEPDAEEEDSDDEFDYLLDEDLPDEEARREELAQQIWTAEVAVQHGYGVHRPMHPTRVLKVSGLLSKEPPPAAVVHLVDADSRASAGLDLCLENLAQTYKGTIFVRSSGRSTLLIDAETCAKVLPPLHADKDTPALIAVKDGVAVNVCPRLQGLTSSDGSIVSDAVLSWLSNSGVLRRDIPPLDALCRIRPEEEALMDYLLQMKQQDDEERYDCGMPGCHKSFVHEHIGIKTDQQEGLIVSEAEVLGEGA